VGTERKDPSPGRAAQLFVAGSIGCLKIHFLNPMKPERAPSVAASNSSIWSASKLKML
jgi:hypothetical protein